MKDRYHHILFLSYFLFPILLILYYCDVWVYVRHVLCLDRETYNQDKHMRRSTSVANSS